MVRSRARPGAQPPAPRAPTRAFAWRMLKCGGPASYAAGFQKTIRPSERLLHRRVLPGGFILGFIEATSDCHVLGPPRALVFAQTLLGQASRQAPRQRQGHLRERESRAAPLGGLSDIQDDVAGLDEMVFSRLHHALQQPPADAILVAARVDSSRRGASSTLRFCVLRDLDDTVESASLQTASLRCAFVACRARLTPAMLS